MRQVLAVFLIMSTLLSPLNEYFDLLMNFRG